MKKTAKRIFWAITLLFWGVAGLMLCEHWQRTRTRYDKLFTYASPIIIEAEKHDLKVFETTLADAPRPPEEVEAKYPVPEDLEGASETEIMTLAEKWEGLILCCDLEGHILKRHAAAQPKMIVQLSERADNVHHVSELTASEHPEYGEDVLFRFRTAVDEWRNPPPPQPHVYGSLGPYIDYVIPLPDFPDAGFRFMFHPFQDSGQSSQKVFVILTQWRWEAFVGGYRANYYERDAYPQYPKSEFWTNSQKFRDEEITVPKPPGVYRVVCIGGSTTVEGPRNDLTYPKLLQQLLRDEYDTKAIEVINCGVDGGSIRGQVFQFDECLALEPDLVIHYNYVNDSGDVINTTLRNTVLREDWRGNIIGFLCKSEFLAFPLRSFWSRFLPQHFDYRKEIETLLMPAMQELHDRTRKAGGHFALSSFAYPDIHHLPDKERHWFRDIFATPLDIPLQFDDYVLSVDAFNEAARAFCARESALYIPVAENIQGGIELFTDTCHMHMKGITRKAEIMFDSLKGHIGRNMKNEVAVSVP